MDHERPSDLSLIEYTGFATKEFPKFAHKHEVHVIVAIHPVKPPNLENRTMQMSSLYDISNSAHCFNKADVGILIHRLGPTRSIIRLSKPVLVRSNGSSPFPFQISESTVIQVS